jgi:AcrR family transcriptional regulator
MASTTDSESSKPARIRDEISDRIIEIVARIAEEEGAHKVTVRKIITELGVTNRVFYNRFANCDEVLRIVYRNAVMHMRENIKPEFHDRESFEQFCIDTAVSVLMQTYDVKMQFRRYVFEHDSLTEENRLWWDAHIREQYRIARERGYVRDVDIDALCYAFWCFCRGYISDAAARSVSLADSVHNFRFGFRCLLGGVLTASALQEISE